MKKATLLGVLCAVVGFASPGIADDDLIRVEDTQVVASDFGPEITGMAYNTTDTMINSASLVFNLYDSSGAKVGEAYANGNSIEPEVPWRFRALLSDSSAASYRLVNVIAF